LMVMVTPGSESAEVKTSDAATWPSHNGA